MRRFVNILTLASLALCLTTATLWFTSHRRGGSVYISRFGTALAAEWGQGDLSFWAGRVDRRCALDPLYQWWAAAMHETALEWFSADPSIKPFTWRRFGCAHCPKFPSTIPTRLVRGKVLALTAPMWAVVAVTGAPPLLRAGAVARRAVVRRRRVRKGRCRECGYDLRGAGERCPECGNETTPPRGAATSVPPRHVGRRRLVFAAVGIVVASALVLPMLWHRTRPGLPRPEDAPSPAAAWLRRAALEIAKVELPAERLDPYDAIIRGQLLLGDTAAVQGVLREVARSAADSPDVQIDGGFHAQAARGYAFLGDVRSFRRHALPAERHAEDARSMVARTIRRDVAAGYASVGDFDSLRTLAKSEPDSANRIDLLAAVGRDPASPNRMAVCLQVIPLLEREARDVARFGHARSESLALKAAADLLLTAGDVATAETTAERVPERRWQAAALEAVAAAQEAVGDVAAARAKRERAKALTRAAALEPRPRARWRSANDGPFLTLIGRATGAIEAGDRAAASRAPAAAEQAAKDINDAAGKVDAYIELAEIHAEAGNMAEARRAFSAAESAAKGDEPNYGKFVLTMSMATLAAAAAGAGDMAFARELADRFPEHERAYAYAPIANRLVGRGEIDAAARLVRERVTGHYLTISARQIARAYAERACEQNVKDWVASQPTPADRAAAMIGAAEGLAGRSFDPPVH